MNLKLNLEAHVTRDNTILQRQQNDEKGTFRVRSELTLDTNILEGESCKQQQDVFFFTDIQQLVFAKPMKLIKNSNLLKKTNLRF